ncbi:MAG: hypothetical protein WEF99_07040 [Thermoanaerobaculia bacterium]
MLVFVARSPVGSAAEPAARPASPFDGVIARNAQDMMAQGRQIFRFDTFGSEAFWGDALALHKAIAGEKNGGVGAGVSPKTALSVVQLQQRQSDRRIVELEERITTESHDDLPKNQGEGPGGRARDATEWPGPASRGQQRSVRTKPATSSGTSRIRSGIASSKALAGC